MIELGSRNIEFRQEKGIRENKSLPKNVYNDENKKNMIESYAEKSLNLAVFTTS